MTNPDLSSDSRYSKDTIKPCPFCGSSAEVLAIDFGSIKTYSVQCGVCTGTVEGPLSDSGITGFVYEDDALEAWNRRV